MKLKLTIEPDRITQGILRACGEVVSDPPVFVPVEPEPDALPNKCILNVLDSTRSNGGEVVMGWKVYLWPRVFVHLIGHSVVCRDGTLRCITPSLHDERRILFLPDPALTFDEDDDEARLGGRMIPLREDAEVDRFIEIEEETQNIKRKLPRKTGVVTVTGLDASRLRALDDERIELIRRITLRTRQPNEVCICDTGRKFRNCCRDDMLRVGPY